MLNQEQIQQIYQWWHVFKNNGNLVEIRCIGEKITFSGYYKNIENLLRDVNEHDDCNVYFTVNPIEESCYGRPQCETMMRNPKNTTADSEIKGRSWLFIDFDCEKVTNVNSTDEEKEYAHKKALDVYQFLKQEGFNEPIVVDSANGYHMYINCQLKASDENNTIVTNFLKALDMLFSDDRVKIDVKTSNLSRIAKLPGTFSRKGSSISSERPQRMSKILLVPSEIVPTSKDYIKKIADIYPTEEVRPSKENNYSTERFDLPSFLQKHNISYRVDSINGGTKYILEHCLFDDSHRGKDAVIFQRDNGAIAYHCFHSHCSHYTWKDVRLKFEPDAYDKKDYKEFQNKQRYYEKYVEPEPIKEENEQDGKKWLSLKDIKTVNDEDLVAIPTGIYALDKSIKGLLLGEISIVSGINASGKTVLLNTLALNAIQKGFNTALWSGELQDYKLKSWILQTAAGRNNVHKIVGMDNAYEANEDCIDRIADWTEGKFFLYNNNYGTNSCQLLSDIKECIQKNKVRYVILDNLMTVDISDKSGDKNERQKQLCLELSSLAKSENVHIIIVAHPRKEANNALLRKESISGTQDLSNIAQNVFLIHRVTDDFEKRASDFWGKEKVNKMMLEGYGNVIEVAKNRSYGVVDYVVGLYYEIETRRFKNSRAENIHYDWESEYIDYNPIPMRPNTNFYNDNDNSVQIDENNNSVYSILNTNEDLF